MRCSCTKFLDEGVEEAAEPRVELYEETLHSNDLDQSLGSHDIAADTRVAVGIDLLSREERGYRGYVAGGRRAGY
jgi:hypothetical protein